MPLDPHDYDARLDLPQDRGWWGIAEQLGPTQFRVTRLGTYDQASERAGLAERVRVWVVGSSLEPELHGLPHIAEPGTSRGRWLEVEPLVASGGAGRSWVFAATGWTLPLP